MNREQTAKAVLKQCPSKPRIHQTREDWKTELLLNVTRLAEMKSEWTRTKEMLISLQNEEVKEIENKVTYLFETSINKILKEQLTDCEKGLEVLE